MNLLPHASGSRPRLACELFAGGVVAGRSPEAGQPLSAIARVDLAPHAIVPGLKPGNIADRVAAIAAVRRALESVGARPNARRSDLTLVIPDAAVRVLLLDFDALPTKLSEALPIVRFRLKKLVPFDPDNAMVSFQIMSTSRAMVRVLAVAIPRDVLSEYESVAREAGFEPGAVLPSTLASVAALNEGEGASLLVNAGESSVTTAIVRAGILLLHRSVELTEFAAPTPANLPAALFETSAGSNGDDLLPLVDRDSTEAEWAAQQPLPEYGRNPYADRVSTEEVTQNQDAVTGFDTLPATPGNGYPRAAGTVDMYAAEGSDTAPVGRSPYASPLLQQQLDAQFHNAAYVAPSVEATLTPEEQDSIFLTDSTASAPYASAAPSAATGLGAAPDRDVTFNSGSPQLAALPGVRELEPRVHELAPDLQSEEIARAISVAVAFFEDNLAVSPAVLLSAGTLGAAALERMLEEQGIAAEAGLRVRELVDAAALAPSATTAQTPRSWLAGVTGALRS